MPLPVADIPVGRWVVLPAAPSSRGEVSAARLGDFVELSAAAAHDIPQATRVVVPDCGHIPHLEAPEQFLTAFLPFLGS